MKTALIAILALALAGCATVRDTATLMVYHVEGKALVAVKTPCGYEHSDKPALLFEFMRPGDVDKFAIVCDADCNCKLVRRTPKMKIVQPPSESGICQ